jgi:hypothetical protein
MNDTRVITPPPDDLTRHRLLLGLAVLANVIVYGTVLIVWIT